MPEDLAAQLPIIKEVLAAMKIQIVTLEGYEADDLIGTLAKKCPFETIIVGAFTSKVAIIWLGCASAIIFSNILT